MRLLRVILTALALLLPSALGQKSEAAFIPFPAPQCTQTLAINQAAATDVKTFTNAIHICFVALVSSTAQSIAIAYGTGTTCATGTTALIGGVSASTSGVADATHGLQMAANSGFVMGTGLYPIAETATAAQHLCVMQSSTGVVSGVIKYIDQ